MGNAPLDLLLHGHDTVECTYWRQEDEETRLLWEASTPQVLGRARQPAARARTAAPAQASDEVQEGLAGEGRDPHTNRGVRSPPHYRPGGSKPHAV
jgi:hypothetical protein